MKAIKYIAISMLTLGVLSCKKHLELEPISELTSENFYEDAAQIEAAIFACYDGLQQTIQIEYMLAEMRSDNTTTVLNEGIFGQIDKFSDSPSNNVLLSYWQLSYNTIMRTNIVLEHSNVVTDATQRNAFNAEARFIRALNYFNLVRLFGGVPVVDKVILSTESDYFTRVDENKVYDFIKADLDYAILNLPMASSKGRPSSTSAKALLAKVLLTLKDYSGAQTYLADVINTGGFSLVSTSYSDVFSESNELNSEIIMAIEFKSQSNSEGQVFSAEMSATGEFGGLNNPTTDFMTMVDPADTLRSSFYITTDATPLCGKYLSGANPGDAGNDWPLLRYADILLMYGEVENELNGPTQEALDYINFTRNRAGLPSLTSATITNADDYRSAMEEERKYELAYENQRWFDLLRTGRALDVMNAHGASEGFTVPSYRLLYPIPQREIDVSNGLLSQNPGY